MALNWRPIVCCSQDDLRPGNSLDETMFLVARSVFWLTVAYLVIKPGVDFNDAAQQAMAAGSQVVVQQIQSIECDSFQCAGGKAVISAALQSPPSAGIPMHETPVTSSVPYPRPRPDWAG